jgi:hypothetical protein
VSQNFGAHFKNVVGDSNGTHFSKGTPHSLLIQPRTGGIIGFLTFVGAWASGGVTPNGVAPVLIDCTAPQPLTCWQIRFTEFTSRTGGSNQTIMQVQGAVWNFSLENSLLCSWFSGNVLNGLLLNFNSTTAGHWQIQNNRIGNCAGAGGNTMSNGIVINQNSGNMWLHMTGNDASDAAVPYTMNLSGGPPDAIIANNLGGDDVVPNVASAASITLPGINTVYNITGTITINSIAGGWSNRRITLVIPNGLIFTANNSGGVCSGANNALPAGTTATYVFSPSNCWLRMS